MSQEDLPDVARECDAAHKELQTLLRPLVLACEKACRSRSQENPSLLIGDWLTEPPTMNIGHGAAEILRMAWEATVDEPVIRDELIRMVRELAPQLIRMHEASVARELFSITQQKTQKLMGHVRNVGVIAHDDVDMWFGLEQLVCAHGTAHEIDIALSRIKAEPSAHDDRLFGIARSLFDDVVKTQSMYQDRHQLPSKRTNIPTMIHTAAVQLACTGNYDAVVGILHSGAYIPNHMHALGSNVGYIEWHKNDWDGPHHDWDGPPVWRTETVDFRRRDNMRILLCENDAGTGTTLQTVILEMQTLSPASVDLCFTGDQYANSLRRAEELQYFDNVFHITELDQSHVYSHMLIYREILLEKLRLAEKS